MPEDTDMESVQVESPDFSASSGLRSPEPFSPPLTNRQVDPRPSSAPPFQHPATPGSSRGPCKESSLLYKKKGGKPKIVDEAVQLMRKLADEPSQKEVEDSAYNFGCLVAQRLREIEKEKDIGARRQCEFDIMSVLTKY